MSSIFNPMSPLSISSLLFLTWADLGLSLINESLEDVDFRGLLRSSGLRNFFSF